MIKGQQVGLSNEEYYEYYPNFWYTYAQYIAAPVCKI